MKKIIFFITFCALSLHVTRAQTIQNLNFENWVNSATAVNWSSRIGITIVGMPLPIALEFATRTTTSHSGQYAMMLKPFHFPGMLVIPAFTAPGICQIGQTSDLDINAETIDQLLEFDFSDLESLLAFAQNFSGLLSKGVPIASTPSWVKAYIKFDPQGTTGDTIMAFAFTTGINPATQQKEYTSMGIYTHSGAIPNYTEITIPLTNTGTNTVPDSISIIFICGTISSNPSAMLYIDDVSVEGHTVSMKENSALTYNVYPNPANHKVILEPRDAHLDYSVAIYDITGKKVMERHQMKGNSELDVRTLTSGTYVLEMNQGNYTKSHKLVIQ